MRGKDRATFGCIKKSERAVSRVLFSRLPESSDHLSGPPIARRHERPTRKSRTGSPYSRIVRETLPYAVLLQAGFSKHPRSPGNVVGSYPTVSPLPLLGAVFFSVVLSMGSPPVPFRDRLALRSSDFPPPVAGEQSPHPL